MVSLLFKKKKNTLNAIDLMQRKDEESLCCSAGNKDKLCNKEKPKKLLRSIQLIWVCVQ